MLDSVDAQERYGALPCPDLRKDVATRYWQDMHDGDRLKYRWGDYPQITPEQATELCQATDKGLYYMVWDIALSQFVAEFSLENFRGRSCEIHFSIHPKTGNKNTALVCKTMPDQILDKWKSTTLPGQPFCDTLIGMIPQPHHASWKRAERSGFKKLCIIPNNSWYFGEIVDTVMLIKERT